MRIIPAIDIIDGKCVRLTKGDYSTRKVYNEDPVEVAKAFEASGIGYRTWSTWMEQNRITL